MAQAAASRVLNLAATEREEGFLSLVLQRRKQYRKDKKDGFLWDSKDDPFIPNPWCTVCKTTEVSRDGSPRAVGHEESQTLLPLESAFPNVSSGTSPSGPFPGSIPNFLYPSKSHCR